MPNIRARGGMREQTISAIVIRADGEREDLGLICYWHKNPLRRWAWKLSKLIKRITN